MFALCRRFRVDAHLRGTPMVLLAGRNFSSVKNLRVNAGGKSIRGELGTNVEQHTTTAFAATGTRCLSWWAKDDGKDGEREDIKKKMAVDKEDAAQDPRASDSTGNASASATGGDANSNKKGSMAPVLQLQGAPRQPNVLALPLDRRPIFPGLLHPIQITDRAVYEALLHTKASGNPYLGLFLRKHDVKTRDFIEVAPSDRILALNEVHSVGTFVQIMQMDPLQGLTDDGQGAVVNAEDFEHNSGDGSDDDSSKRVTELRKIFSSGNSSADGFNKGKSSSDRMLASAKEESWTMLVKAHRRIQIKQLVNPGPPPMVRVHHVSELPTSNYDADTIRACTNEVLNTLRDVIRHNPLLREHMQFFSARFDMSDPHHVCNFAASLTSADGAELQEILEAFNLETRLKKVLTLLKKEVQLNSLQEEISKQVEETISANQRKYFLNEQLKQIKKELGLEHDDKDAILKKYQERIDEINSVVRDDDDDEKEEEEKEGNEKEKENDGDLNFAATEGETATSPKLKKEKKKFIRSKLPEDASKVIEEEMKKLSTLEKTSPEFNVTRAYLDWLLCLPWGKCTLENLDVKHAGSILEADHFGLDDVKERILEFIAVGNLRGTVQGNIILLVGPPGVGKTSIGKSIAHALDREFYRFSVGGLSDVSEIKGHRRTYVGSMPGKLIQCLKTAGVSNPVVLIDEIDKLGSGYRGDPASALLELLDPAQNSAFLDHYLDVPVDLSKVLFVCTANSTDTIPGPLLDRMEVLRLSGYDLPEKVEIAKRYLEPRARKDCGLEEETKEVKGDSDSSEQTAASKIRPSMVVPESLKLDESALFALTRWYCREAGVRKLEQHIERIYRKSSLLLLQAEPEEIATKDWAITESNLDSFVGKPRFQSDKLFASIPPPGVVMGLAWSTVGGSALYIETTCIHRTEKKGTAEENVVGENKSLPGVLGFSVHITGQLGEVMKESTSLALTNAKRTLLELDRTNDFFEVNQIHLHVPEGATPKDGPSAGVTMTTALLGLALGKSVVQDLAMTGEISLTGMVLPVGGIKEKVIAARRSGVTTIILPDGCRKDADELPDYLKDGLQIHFVRTYDEVYNIAFGLN